MVSVALYPGSIAEDTRAAFAQWLRVAWHALPKGPLSRWLNRSQLSLELLASPDGIAMVLAFPSSQAQTVLTRQLVSLLPGSEILPPPWPGAKTDAHGLAAELVLLRGEKASLQEWKPAQPDPVRELLTACADLQTGERAVVQLVLRPSPRGSGLLGAPTFQALLRLAAFGPMPSRRRTLVRGIAAALGAHHGPGWFRPNPWILSQHCLLGDLRRRAWPLVSAGQFLITADEAAAIYHVPSSKDLGDIPLMRATVRRVKAPASLPSAGLALGFGLRGTAEAPVHLEPAALLYHLLVEGPTGTGKTTFLTHLARELATAGWGMTILDPHADLAPRVARSLPPDVADRTVYLPFADPSLVPALRLFSAAPGEEHRVADEFVELVRRVSGVRSWGPVLELTLRYTAQAVLETGGTVIDMARALEEEGTRSELLHSIKDPEAARFLARLSRLPGRQAMHEAMSSLNRLHRFLSAPPVRQLLGQRHALLTPEDMLARRSILLCDLSGLGQQNAKLIGSLLVARLKDAALSRRTNAPPHALILDESSWFLSHSLVEVADQTRKFGLGLVLGTQRLSQLQPSSLQDAILSNAGNILVLQLGEAEEARTAARLLGSPAITPEDVRHLSLGEAYLRPVAGGRRLDAFWLRLPAPRPATPEDEERARRIQARSRSELMASRRTVDDSLRRERSSEQDDREVGDLEAS